MITAHKVLARARRHRRVRKKIVGTAARPRLVVFRSNRHIYAQLVDDTTGRTLAAASTLDPDARADVTGKQKADAAKTVGMLVGKRAKDSGIAAAIFDRGGYKYHGRVRQVAEGAREAGLSF